MKVSIGSLPLIRDLGKLLIKKKSMGKCYICKKRRKTAGHYMEIPTKDGQEIDHYDQELLCMECSNKITGWHLFSTVEKKNGKFVVN